MSIPFGIRFKRRSRASTKNKDFNFIILSTISTMLLLLIPNSVVFGITNPWDLFQQLCPTGRLATGPQCQNFFTTGINTAIGTCPTGYVLQNGVCVPFTTPVQTAPIANAGPDQTITPLLGTTVTLDGTASFATTSGATIISYSWVQTSGTSVTLNGATTANPTFVAPTVSTSTPLTFSLTVTDSNGAISAPDSVIITLNPSTQ